MATVTTAVASVRSRERLAPATVTAAVAAAVVLAWWLGRDVAELRLGAPPFKGAWSVRIEPWIAPAVVFAVAGAWWGPSLARRLPWPQLLVWSTVASAGWAGLLALGDGGPHAIAAPLATEWDYLAAVPTVGSPFEFVGGFVDRLPNLPLHARSHPPGTVLAFWGLDRIGLGGPGWAAAVVLASVATTTTAVLVALREVAGVERARRAAPFLVLAPFAVWAATSADGLFMAVGAWAVALLVVAGGRVDLRRRTRVAWGGGLLGGAALMLSYGVALLALVPIAVLVTRRRWEIAWRALAGAALVVGLFALAGFWWPSGLEAARDEYWRGVASVRPYGWFLVLNLASAAAAVGPAAIGGLRRAARSRRCRPWMLVPVAAVAAIVLADASGLSKGEVERIWLPFFPWVTAAVVALPWQSMRAWLATSAGTGVALQVLLRSPW